MNFISEILTSSKRLRKLTLSDNEIKNSGLATLCQNPIQLDLLEIDYCNITSEGIKPLEELFSNTGLEMIVTSYLWVDNSIKKWNQQKPFIRFQHNCEYLCHTQNEEHNSNPFFLSWSLLI
eukprot:TRINITY_DN3397_c0_g1_i1.p1 TRINITY_DN3397_c0_g1~~TRINITY_DN3397_c0_g1_i1.p1  ORF type:complete len:121 (+),score=11.08 TRINITY_DN3397_c0_g1_i1:429-791(+)